MLPSKQDILDYIRDNPGKAGKKDIARFFGIKGAMRAELKVMLRELQADGDIARKRGGFRPRGALPPVGVLLVQKPDENGDIWAIPVAWDDEDGEPPRIDLPPSRDAKAVGAGDRVLAKIIKDTPDGNTDAPAGYYARIIRKISAGPQTFLGVFRETSEGGRIQPVSKKSDQEWLVGKADVNGAKEGELVEVERAPGSRNSMAKKGRVVERLGDPTAPKAISLIAIHEHEIPNEFPDEVLAEAGKAQPVDLGAREDLRHLPLFTIDPADARDHDDAICALPDPDPKNLDGHIVWVAIADVAHYVRPGSELDIEARKRGNSTYFPDRVVPMLPEALSGDLCSLHQDVDRACMAVEIKLDRMGQKLSHRFTRGLMQSPATLSYEQAQAAADGEPDEQAAPLMEHGIKPLWAAYNASLKERAERQPLALNLPERQIKLSDTGQVTSVAFKDGIPAHQLVETFMVLANVCAAETLEAKRQRLIYRVHEEPGAEKLESLRKVADSFGLTLAKGQVLKTMHFNRLLEAAKDTDDAEAINISVLRSMTQAYYGPENFGHFGLNLKKYAHFTSPIRRYADLIVHRALIAAHGWGDDGLTAEDEAQLAETAELISMTERRSMMAERDTADRYLSSYLSERVGNEFAGRISGVAGFGFFVKLDETGADGIVPVSTLGREYFHFDKKNQTLMGEDTGTLIKIGTRVLVRLTEAVAVTGGLTLELLEHDGKKMSPVKSTGRRKVATRRRAGRVKKKRNAKSGSKKK